MLHVRHCSFGFSVAVRRSTVLTALSLALLTSTSHAQVTPPTGSGNTPLSLTGWNSNIINSNGGPSVQAFDVENNFGYYANGYQGGVNGLPTSGYTAYAGNQYQFQSYSGNNALFLAKAGTAAAATYSTSGTLNLTTPTAYRTLSFMATSANANGATTGDFTLTFSDGTTSTYTGGYNAPDWYRGAAGTTGPYSYVTQTQRVQTNSAGVFTSAFGITETNVTLNAADQSKQVSKITFASNGANETAIFAVSGFTGTAATPGTVNSINIPSGSLTGVGFIANGNGYTYQKTLSSILTPSLRLTDGQGGEASSFFAASKVNVAGAFTSSFSFTKTGGADGLTFLLQGNTPYGVGTGGGGLGYTGTTFAKSIGIALNDYNGSGVALVQNGSLVGSYVAPTASFSNGTLFTANLAYDGTNNLLVTLTNTGTGAQIFNSTYAVGSIASLVGGNSAYIGFTGGTGGVTETQDIYSLSYNLGSAATPEPASLALLPVGLAGLAQINRRRRPRVRL